MPSAFEFEFEYEFEFEFEYEYEHEHEYKRAEKGEYQDTRADRSTSTVARHPGCGSRCR